MEMVGAGKSLVKQNESHPPGETLRGAFLGR